jgi:NTE family protein
MSKNVALVLSSGGARGVAHIGVIEELVKSGYTITSIAGASMGALVGGMYAKGTLPAFTEWLLGFTKMDVLKFMDLTIGHGGLVKGEKILKALEEYIGDTKIENLPIQYSCVAADLIGHKEVVFNKGSLLDAIRASISIPTVFLPVSIGNMLLVDGGVLNPLPIDLIHREAGDILIAVNVNANIPYTPPAPIPLPNEQESYYGKVRAIINERWSGVIDQYVDKYRNVKQPKPKQVNMFDVISESINLAQNKAANIYIEKYNPDVVIETSFETATAYDFYKSVELIEAGREACRKAMKKFEKQ